MERIAAMESRMLGELRDAVKGFRQLSEDFNLFREQWAKEKVELKEHVADLEKRLMVLEKKEEWKNGEDRRSNLIITGKIPERQRNLLKNVECFLKEDVKVDVRVRNVTVLQDRNERGEMRILAKMDTFKEKMAVMNQKWRLRRMRGGVVYIDNDLTAKQREVQKIIRDKAKEERNRGKSVRIGFQRLNVDDKCFTVEEGDLVELETREKFSTKERNRKI